MGVTYSAWTSESAPRARLVQELVKGEGTSATRITCRLWLELELTWGASVSGSVSLSRAASDLGSASSRTVAVSGDAQPQRRLWLLDTVSRSTSGSWVTWWSPGCTVSGLVIAGVSRSLSIGAGLLSGTSAGTAYPLYGPAVFASSLTRATPDGTSARLTWSVGDADADQWTSPVAAIRVYRAEASASGESVSRLVATLAGTATEWTDPSTPADAQVAYEVVASNALGSSSTVAVLTMPGLPPVDLVWSRAGGSASLEWQRRTARGGQYLRLETGSDGSTWTASGTPSLVSGSSWSGALSASAWWRARVEIVSSGGVTVSSWAVLSPVRAPAVPTLVAPLVTQSAGSAVEFRFVHMATDGTSQQAGEVRYRVAGGSWVTVSAGTSSVVSSAAALPAGLLEWQARTRGQHADWSPWSAITSVTLAEPPTVTITSPASGATITADHLTLVVAYADPGGAAMTGWARRLSDASGAVVEEVSGTGALSSVAFAATLNNLSSYTAQVRATSGAGLWSAWAVVGVAVEFMRPAAPTLTAVWSESTGVVEVSALSAPGVSGVSDSTVLMRVERSTDLATWSVLASSEGVQLRVTDSAVPLGRKVWYRAVSVGVLGSAAYSPTVSVTTDTGRVWLTAADGQSLAVQYNLGFRRSLGHELERVRYLGRTVETSHFGEGRPQSVSVQAAQIEVGLATDWTGLLGQTVFYRDPTGVAFWASLDSVEITQDNPHHRAVSFTASETTN